MPLSWDDVQTKLRLRRPVLFEVFRADQRAARDAELEAERRLRDRRARQEESERRVAACVEQVRAERWTDPVANVHRLIEQGAMPAFPSAAEYATWSDERIAAQRVDPEEIPEGRPFGWLGEDEDEDGLYAAFDPDDVGTVDAHPVNRAVEQVEEAQRALRQAEATRVQAALSAWRVAEATVTGTPDATIDGLDEQYWAAFDAKAAHERIQAVTAPERHARAMTRMDVTLEPLADGMAALTAVLPAPEAVSILRRLDAVAVEAARVEGESRSIAALRAHAMMDVLDEGLFRDATPGLDGLAIPGRRGVQCEVALLLPAMTALDHSDVPAVLEGYGTIDLDTAQGLAGNATSWIKVLTDPITGAVIDIGRDKYRPTDDMRALLGLLDRG